MRVFHICGNFIGNTLYQELFKNLSLLDVKQDVYVAVKDKSYIGLNYFKDSNVSIDYYHNLKVYHRALYFRKIYTQYQFLAERYFKDNSYNCIHAHTLFSDGGTAYLLHKKYNIPYIVNIRNTDINIFFKYFKHTKIFIYNVLINSSKIIFISYAYVNKLEKYIPSSLFDEIKHKFVVIPNAIHNDYFNDIKLKNNVVPPVKLVTVGKLDKNKNIIIILKVLKKLQEEGWNISLDVVGEGSLMSHLVKYASKNNILKFTSFHGYLKRSEIIKIFDQSDIFVLLSLKETFGVSYIEAMSRGLPLIYTKNEGIDGYFKQGEVGYAVNPLSVSDIASAIKTLITDYDLISRTSYDKSQGFKWNVVAEKYFELYQESQ